MVHAFDATQASPARVFDYWLGGKDNYAEDRQVGDDLARKAPEVRQVVRANRAFLVRAVRFLAEQGVRQFIDLGSGFPTSPNVHEVARRVHRDARVVYVDNDPIVVAHDRALHNADKTGVIHGNLRDLDRILEQRSLHGLIDFVEPVAVLAVAVLHFLCDADSAAVVSRFRDRMAPGSYLVVTHGSPGTRTDIDDAAEQYRRTTADIWVRTPEQIRGYFTGLELVEPGLVPVQEWRPDLSPSPAPHAGEAVFLAGVARVPGTGDE